MADKQEMEDRIKDELGLNKEQILSPKGNSQRYENYKDLLRYLLSDNLEPKSKLEDAPADDLSLKPQL